MDQTRLVEQCQKAVESFQSVGGESNTEEREDYFATILEIAEGGVAYTPGNHALLSAVCFVMACDGASDAAKNFAAQIHVDDPFRLHKKMSSELAALSNERETLAYIKAELWGLLRLEMTRELNELLRKFSYPNNPELRRMFAVLIYSGVAYSPEIEILDPDFVGEFLLDYGRGKDLTLLNCGGGEGSLGSWAEEYQKTVLDIDESSAPEGAIIADICNCPEIKDHSFDVVYSMNMLEHVLEPWNAASEMVRLVKLGGLVVTIAPFAWRFHPVPIDLYRFTHNGLEYLFTRTGQIETVFSGYDTSYRRINSSGGKEERMGYTDVPPHDELGGWRENWEAIFVGQKTVE